MQKRQTIGEIKDNKESKSKEKAPRKEKDSVETVDYLSTTKPGEKKGTLLTFCYFLLKFD